MNWLLSNLGNLIHLLSHLFSLGFLACFRLEFWRSQLKLLLSKSSDSISVTNSGGSSRYSAQRPATVLTVLRHNPWDLVCKKQNYPLWMCCIKYRHGGVNPLITLGPRSDGSPMLKGCITQPHTHPAGNRLYDWYAEQRKLVSLLINHNCPCGAWI